MSSVKKLVVAAVAAGSLLAGASVFADRGGDRGSHRVERMTERLELDDSQSAALESLQEALRAMHEAARGEGDLRSSLMELAESETFDQAEALALINARTEAVNQQAPQLVAAAATFFDGLNAEQKAEFADMSDRMGKRHGGKRHGGHMGQGAFEHGADRPSAD